MEDEKRQFRFIVSPEDAGDADLTAFTRRLMAQVQADLGRVLVWGAVNHWNTDNPHVHVIVRGIDEAGRDVTIDGRYLAEGMRSRAQAILTNELGPRTEVDVQNQLAREVRQERFTSLDRVLQSCEQRGGVVLEARLPRDGRASRVRLTARLGRLEQLGLAVADVVDRPGSSARAGRTPSGVSGRRTTSSSGCNAAVPGADPSRFVVVDGSSTRPPVDGVVRAKGLHDELAARPFVVIEGVDGRVYYAATERGGRREVRPGGYRPARRRVAASIGSPAFRPSPRVLLRTAWRHPSGSRSGTADRPGSTRSPADAGRAPGPSPARSRRASRVGTPPCRRWASRAPCRECASPRLRGWRRRRLAPSWPPSAATPSRSSPAGLAGTLTMGPTLSSGRQYAVVMDDDSKRLWVLPASKQLRRLEGQQVEGGSTARAASSCHAPAPAVALRDASADAASATPTPAARATCESCRSEPCFRPWV